MPQTIARSISRPARERLRRLQAGHSTARVLAVFERACDLLTTGGGIVALTLPEIGDGPFNVVVDGAAGIFAGIEPGLPVTVEGMQLRVGGLRVDLENASTWEPRPDWERLCSQRATISARLPLLRALCLRQASTGSFLSLLKSSPPNEIVLSTAQAAADALREGWVGDAEQLQAGASGLAGLGSGLTPSGDDFLSGVMLWAWLAHPAPPSFCQTLATATIPRTTTLSAAFLRAAARGECSAPWHTLLAALNAGRDAEIATAAQEILAHGATSGADSLAGFLYLF